MNIITILIGIMLILIVRYLTIYNQLFRIKTHQSSFNTNEFLEVLKRNFEDIYIIDDIPGHPVMTFRHRTRKYKIFSEEKYEMRTKYFRNYDTFLEISRICDLKINILKKNIDFLGFKSIIKKNTIITNISKLTDYEKLICIIR